MVGVVVRSIMRALAIVQDNERPVDWQLRQFFKNHPGLGRRDRGLIAETLFDVLRNRRLYQHLAQSGTGNMERRLMLLSWSWPQRLPTRSPLAELDDAERRWLERVLKVDPTSLSPALAVSVPDWLWDRVANEYGPGAAQRMMQAMLVAAPLDLRVNPLKSRMEEVLTSLKAAGISAMPLLSVPGAIRVEGKPALERTPAFENGWVEVQDAGSQALAYLANPRRGQLVVDFCAGAGGKSLAMAGLMKSTGQIYACDVSLMRLHKLRPRLERAGVSNIQPFAIDSETDPKLRRLEARADLVFVDAPCSGFGTLRRNPDLKWRSSEAQISELQGKQQRILLAAARLVRPGGALVYATCSLLRAENEAVAELFGQAYPDWVIEPALPLLAQAGVQWPDQQAVTVPSPYLKLTPDQHGTDGFFAVRWRRP